MRSQLLPLGTLLLHQSLQLLVLRPLPAVLRLVAQPPEPAVTHFGIFAGDESSDVLESCIFVSTELEEEGVLLLSPSSLSLLVAFGEEVLARDQELLGVSLIFFSADER